MADPIVMRGSSDAYGSWKTICISRRSPRSCSFLSVVSSVPRNLTEPAVGTISCRTQRPTVDLPEPDSPTRPRVWPAPIENDTSDTACTVPLTVRTPFELRTLKSLTRCSTERTGACAAGSEAVDSSTTALTRRAPSDP